VGEGGEEEEEEEEEERCTGRGFPGWAKEINTR
jgi:hypothetical protein